jgi:hypothetical protein
MEDKFYLPGISYSLRKKQMGQERWQRPGFPSVFFKVNLKM